MLRHKNQMVGPAPATSTPALTGTPRAERPLPPDLLRDASRRMGILALLAAALWILATVLYHISLRSVGGEAGAHWMTPLGSDWFVIPGFIASIALYVYARHPDRDPRVVLDVGCVYLVFTSLLLGVLFHWEHADASAPALPMISWIGAVVLIVAAIAPSPPLKTFIVGAVSVSMNPIGMLIARARGVWHFGATSNAWLMHYPDYLLVGVSVVIAYVLTNLGQQVAKAREMGSYQLGELLGEGGMGEVYRAKHRMLARPAAIKLIRPEVIAARGESASVAIERFRREADAVAKLRSPHTVAVYDFGVTDDSALYFVMELLEGMTLEKLVRSTGPVPAGRAVHLLQQACDSLAEAHAYSLVHRDIKPANIHVGRVGLQEDFVKILDFGLVKAINRTDTELTMATLAAMPVGGGVLRGTGDTANSVGALTPGTPAYMAPELVGGDAIDGRADIYALGCVAYYLLTGSLVFKADTVVQMLVQHMSAAPIPPSQRTELPVPAGLERIVLACLAKDPKDRPQTATILGQQLADLHIGGWDERQAAAWWQMQQ